MHKVVLSAALILIASPAVAQSSASFPDLSQRAAPSPTPPSTAAAPPEPAPRFDARVPEPAYSAPSQHDGSRGPAYAPSFVTSPSPAFTPTFAPAAPVHDVPGEGSSTASSPTLLVGALMIGLPYATGLGIGASEGFENGSGWLAAPVAGPWLALSGRRDPCADAEEKKGFDSEVGKCVGEPLVRGMLVLDGVLQAGGTVLMLVGASSGRPQRTPPTRVMAAPSPVGRSGYGVAVAGLF